MKVNRIGLSYSSRSHVSVSTALVVVLASGLSARMARAQAPVSAFQNVVMSQETELGAVPSAGGGQSGQEPAGSSMAVDAHGNVIMGNTYGGAVVLFSANAATISPLPAPTILGTPGNNPDAMAVDSSNNLYVGFATLSTVVKVPYIAGAAHAGYGTIVAPTGSTPNCTGTDTVECVMNNLNTDSSGVSGLVFDSKGDLFYSTTNISDNGAGTAPNSIWECTAACLYTGTPAATLLFTEPTSSSPTTTGQLNVGGLAVDSYGDLFFTDSAIYYDSASSTTNNQESISSHLNELVYTSGTGFATTPTVLYTYAPSTPSDYDAEIDGVTTDASGTVYALIQNTGGVLAFPNSSGVIATNKVYMVSTVTGKLMTNDSLGNLYVDTYISGDAIVRVGVNNLTAAASAIAAPSTSTFTTILNDGGCSPTPVVTYAVSGTSASAFSAATTGTCSTTLTGAASFSATLNFTPAAVGTSTATLTATDTNSNSGTAAVSGTGEGTVATPVFSLAAGTYTGAQPLTLSDTTLGASIYYTTDGSTPAANAGTSTLYSGAISVGNSETVNAIAVDAGDTSSAIATAAYVINVAGASATPTFSVAPGTYTTPQAVAITDTTAGVAIYYTTNGTAPTASSTLYSVPIVVSSTETINAIAVGGGFGNSGVASSLYTINLPTSAFQNIVMSQVTSLGAFPSAGGLSGSNPAGNSFVINPSGDVITGNTYGNQVLEFNVQTGVVTPLASFANIGPIAMDNQGNLYIGGNYTNNIVKVPYNAATNTYAAISAASSSTSPPACTGNDTTECNFGGHLTDAANGYYFGVVSMLFDPQGDFFFSMTNGNTAPNSIWECTVACLSTGTPAPVMLYQEPTSTTVATTGQLNIGGMALDPYGDLFFTDSAVGTGGSNQTSYGSNLKELVYTSGSGFAATPTVIYSYTPTLNQQSNDQIDGVAVAPNGTVYALIEDVVGTLAFPNANGVVNTAGMYLASTEAGKMMAIDGLGNLYIDSPLSTGDAMARIGVDDLVATGAAVGNPSTATNITTILNDGGCTATPPTVTFAATGTSASAFSGATTGACAGTTYGTSSGASFATTLTFTPTAVGTNSAVLTATDSLHNTGVASVSGTGTPAPPAATPTFSVAAGTYTTVQTVSITDTSTAASIYYTTDGSTPTASSTLYTAPITVGATETLSAIATGNGFSISPVATALYTVNLPTAATPTFSVAAGTYTTPQTVSIVDATAGAAIYYTTNGSTPTASSTLYAGPITIGATETINAVAIATNYNNSPIASALYTINLPAAATPAFSVAAGTYASVQTISISDATSGASIYYTVDGSTPAVGAGTTKLYSTSITVAVSTTINAIAVAGPDFNTSAVASAAYIINLPATAFAITSANPTVTVPAGGSGTATLTLTANAAFNGSISFTCAGFLPIGATCSFSPTSVSLVALGTATTVFTVSVPATTAAIPHRHSPLLPGSMMAVALCLLGLRKRRRLQLMMFLVVSGIGLTMFSGCTSTSSPSSTSSQIVVTAIGASCPYNSPGCKSPTQVTENLDLVLTAQ